MAATKNPLIRLGHIKDELENVAAAFDGITFEVFAANYMFRRTAEHAILIISEAVKALDPSLTAPYSTIDWYAIRNIGNLLRHEYFNVDPKVLWRIVTDSLPELRPVIEKMIQDLAQ